MSESIEQAALSNWLGREVTEDDGAIWGKTYLMLHILADFTCETKEDQRGINRLIESIIDTDSPHETIIPEVYWHPLIHQAQKEAGRIVKKFEKKQLKQKALLLNNVHKEMPFADELTD